MFICFSESISINIIWLGFTSHWNILIAPRRSKLGEKSHATLIWTCINFCLKTDHRRTLYCHTYDRISRSVLQNMAKDGYLAHVWRFEIYFEETLIENAFTLEDVFQCCPSLTHLSIQMNILWPYDRQRKNRVGLSTVLKNKAGLASVLKEGFRKLQYVKLSNCLRNMFRNSWAIYQEILT